MFEAKIRTGFSAAHFLRYSQATPAGGSGKCERVHGHNYKIEIAVSSEQLSPEGMVLDFHKLKEIASEVVAFLDHQLLNELPFFKELNPTTENIAHFFYQEISKKIPTDITLSSVTVWETEKTSASYCLRV